MKINASRDYHLNIQVNFLLQIRTRSSSCGYYNNVQSFLKYLFMPTLFSVRSYLISQEITIPAEEFKLARELARLSRAVNPLIYPLDSQVGLVLLSRDSTFTQ